MSLRIYKKQLDYTYAFGIFPTIELLEKAPEKVMAVLINDTSEKSDGVKKIRELCIKHRITFDNGPRAISKIAKKENTHAVGVFRKYKKELNADETHILLVNPSDMGNVGTIIRAMAAFGIKNLAMVRPAIDIFDPKVVRSSMGSFFDLNFEYFDTYRQYADKYQKHIMYPFVLGGKFELGKVQFKNPATLIFGNEGSGLDPYFEQMENTVAIKHTNKVDSLNLSVAVSIVLYENFKK